MCIMSMDKREQTRVSDCILQYELKKAEIQFFILLTSNFKEPSRSNGIKKADADNTHYTSTRLHIH